MTVRKYVGASVTNPLELRLIMKTYLIAYAKNIIPEITLSDLFQQISDKKITEVAQRYISELDNQAVRDFFSGEQHRSMKVLQSVLIKP